MAKIKFGMMMTDASGKLGGHVFAKNRGGNYVRTKGIPGNPQTVAQMANRGLFASISSGWSALTEAQRATFNGFVGAYATTDIFGDLRNPSGKALYQRLNQNLGLTGQPLINVCSSPEAVPFANISEGLLELSAEELTVQQAGNTTGSTLLVFATPQLSQGTRFVKNDLRVVDVVAGSDGTVISFYGAYVEKFGIPTAGANIYVGVKVVNSNGQASPLETIKISVEA